MKCTVTGTPYTVFGYEGKQVRDNIAQRRPGRRVPRVPPRPRARPRSTTSAAGGESNCSMLEAIEACERIAGARAATGSSVDEARIGDHRWWISDLGEFQRDYPDWS